MSRQTFYSHHKNLLSQRIIRQKAILGVPSPLEMAQAEKIATEAGEATNKEVLQVARSIYGTGLRA